MTTTTTLGPTTKTILNFIEELAWKPALARPDQILYTRFVTELTNAVKTILAPMDSGRIHVGGFVFKKSNNGFRDITMVIEYTLSNQDNTEITLYCDNTTAQITKSNLENELEKTITNLVVNNNDCCDGKTVGDASAEGLYTFPTLIRGDNQTFNCSHNNTLSFVMECSGSPAAFNENPFDSCPTENVAVGELENLDESQKCTASITVSCITVTQTIVTLLTLTNQKSATSVTAFGYISSIITYSSTNFNTLTNAQKTSSGNQLIKALADTIVSVSPNNIAASQKKNGDGSSLRAQIVNIESSIASSIIPSRGSFFSNNRGFSLLVVARTVTTIALVSETNSISAPSRKRRATSSNQNVEVNIDQANLGNFGSAVSISSFESISIFQSADQLKIGNGENITQVTYVLSKIVSAKLNGSDTLNLTSPLGLTFPISSQPNVSVVVKIGRWDETIQSAFDLFGGWTTADCTTISVNDSHVRGECNRLGIFAVVAIAVETVPTVVTKTKVEFLYEVDWNSDLLNTGSSTYIALTSNITTTMQNILSSLESARFRIGEITFNQSTNGYTEVSLMLNYTLTSGDSSESITYCQNTTSLITKSKVEAELARSISKFKVNNYDCCDSETVGDANGEGIYNYPTVNRGDSTTITCQSNHSLSFVLLCTGNPASYISANNPAYDACPHQNSDTDSLENLDENQRCTTTKTTNCLNVTDTLNSLLVISNRKTAISSSAFNHITNMIVYSSDNFQTLSRVHKRTSVSQIVQIVGNTVNSISSSNIAVSQRSGGYGSSMRKQLANIERSLVTSLSTTNSSFTSSNRGFSLFINFRSTATVCSISETNAISISSRKRRSVNSNMQVSISRENLFGGSGLSLSSYENVSIFQTADQLKVAVGESVYQETFTLSKIVSVKLNGRDDVSIDAPIEFSFPITSLPNVSAVTAIRRWDETIKSSFNLNGGWTDGDCTTLSVNNSLVTGSCTRLGIFAVVAIAGLASPPTTATTTTVAPTIHQVIDLGVVTWVGAAIAMAFLIISVFVYLFSRKLLANIKGKIFLSLCITLLALLITFVVGIEYNSNHARCQVIGGILQYFVLSAFFWLFVETCNLYRTFVKQVITENDNVFYIVSAIFAWGLPFIIMGIAVPAGGDDYASGDLCAVYGTTFYTSLLAPVVIILAFNIIMHVYIIFVSRESNQGLDESITDIPVTLVYNILLGLAFLFASYNVYDGTNLYEWLFLVFVICQALYLFLFYVIRNRNVKSVWLSRQDRASVYEVSSQNAREPWLTSRTTSSPV